MRHWGCGQIYIFNSDIIPKYKPKKGAYEKFYSLNSVLRDVTPLFSVRYDFNFVVKRIDS